MQGVSNVVRRRNLIEDYAAEEERQLGIPLWHFAHEVTKARKVGKPVDPNEQMSVKCEASLYFSHPHVGLDSA